MAFKEFRIGESVLVTLGEVITIESKQEQSDSEENK